jgi:5-methylcytosine-specific restriction protein A
VPQKAKKIGKPQPSRSFKPATRGTTAERGYGSRWQQFSRRFLRQNPLCVECEKNGKISPAEVCDHIVPHKGDMAKFWEGPFQGLCVKCHNRKSAKE